MTKNIIILGGDGDGIVVASFIEDMILNHRSKLKIAGFLNDSGKKEISGYSVLGTLKDVQVYCKEKDIFFVSALLKTKHSYSRSKLIEGLDIPVSKFETIIHPTAFISKSAIIGRDTVIGPHVAIMPNVRIGNHCSIRASASVGHDCVVENFCYIGPNATLAGKAVMKTGAHLGPNGSILDSKVLGSYAVAGMGTCVVEDVKAFDVVFGCPAKKVGKAIM